MRAYGRRIVIGLYPMCLSCIKKDTAMGIPKEKRSAVIEQS